MTDYWIGATSLGNGPNYYWMGYNKEPMNFTNWLSGEPNNLGGTEQCVHMIFYLMRSNAPWNDANCLRLCYFVCEEEIVHDPSQFLENYQALESNYTKP